MVHGTKTAIITGGTSGIGAATARALAAENIYVYVASRSEPNGDLLNMPRIQFIATDVTKSHQLAALIDQVVSDRGSLDVAVNCAGYEGQFHTVDTYPDEDFKDVFEVNVLGTFYALKHEVRAMRSNSYGAIVNMASIAGLKGIPLASPYAASKSAVIGLTRSSALEVVSHGIRINAVAPSLVNTAMADRLTQKTGASEEQFTLTNPMQRAARTDEVVSTILWLLSDDASFITGQTISVDAGQSIA